MRQTFMFLLCATLSAWLFLLPTASAQGDPSIGLLSKIILEVSRKPVGKEWVQAQRGQTLLTGDMLKTGERSMAIIKFKDNSLLRLRERSQVTITGMLKGTAFSKSVTVDKGVVGFNVKKQQPEEEFRFTSPTSVASIRGTGGLLAVADTSDTLTVVENMVRFTNKPSSRSIDVRAGFTGISSRSGRLEVRPSTQIERREADDAVRGTDRQNQLKLQLRNGKGQTRDLIIDFKE